MRNLFLLLLAFVGCQAVLAQAPARITIRGVAADSAGAPLAAATVMLLTPKDSTLINFGRTNDKGAFEFRNVKNGNYLLKMSYVGYIPYQQEIKPSNEAVLEMGSMKMKPITRELFEVVIKTAKAPLMIRGDTIEYNVSSFKVPPGATVEDLLKKLPGVQVDQDGNIKAQGQDVKKVTVDGKQFFGSDPKQATKNLPAEALSRVQVYNDKTEQSKITGVDDGKKEKTINLELKESHKKGGFGKLTAGIGPMSKVEGAENTPRAEVKGNYNRFNQKEQFSVVGLGNNTNQTGLSWDDYQDFRGSQSFNWGDDGEFGFSNGGRFIIFSEDDNGGFSIPVNGNRGRGFSNNFAGGTNYNYDAKKTKFSGSYYYNQIRQTLDAERFSERFLPQGGSFTTNDDNVRTTFNRNHRFSLRFEKNLDSLNTLLFIGNGRSNEGQESYSSLQTFRSSLQNSQTQLRNNSSFNTLAFVGTLIFRHKFRKKGRSFAASASYNRNDTDGEGDQLSFSRYVGEPAGSPLPRDINQRTDTRSESGQLKASLLYIEPVSKKIFWESFYNFSVRKDEVDRDVINRPRSAGEQEVRNDTLSRYYTNDYLYNRIGTGLRYSFKGLNVSAGVAGLQFELDGRFAPDQTSRNFTNVNRTFQTVVPNISLNYDLKNNRWLGSDYTVDVQMPSSRDLQPVVDNTNVRFIRQGNPNLLPQLTHRISTNFGMFNPANFINLFFNASYGFLQNQIVQSQFINDSLVTITRPENISGGRSLWSYFNFGFPLKKTKATMNLNTSVNFQNNPIYINNVRTRTNSQNYNFGLRLDLTPSDVFTFFANANWGITNTTYSLNTIPDQQVYNHRYGGEMNIKMPKNVYFTSNLNYQVYINRRFDLEQNVPILNLSLYKIFMKDNRGELRLGVYDLFKRNLGINQQAFQNQISTERVQTLSRYFMLSFTYNMRGVKAQMRRSGGY